MGSSNLSDIWPIENRRTTVGSELRSIIPTATNVDIATAYVTNSALDSILPALRKASYAGPVRIIAGIKDSFTEPSALRRLLTVSRERGEVFKIKLSRDPHFHWKAYYVVNGKTATAIIGSSNLTSDGLGTSGELNIAVSLSFASRTFRTLHKPFDKEWARAAVRDEAWVKLYESHRLRHPPCHVPLGPTAKLLGMKPSMRDPSRPDFRRGLLYCEGYFSRATDKVIEETTNWDDKEL